VVDFGLARATENMRASSDSSALLLERLTRTNVILGTKGYMAPEQLLGLPVGPRCDQFSFCVTLFEALYGVHPYPGDNALETARAYADGEVVRPLHRRGVPARIHRVLERGLSIEPDARFRDMAALVDALAMGGVSRSRRWGMVAAIVATAWASVGATLLVQREDRKPEPVCDAGPSVGATLVETAAGP